MIPPIGYNMELKVIGSSSLGNGYVLQNETEALILECGLPFKGYQRALDFNISKVVGALVTHEHGDHAKFIRQFTDKSINVYASKGTFRGCELMKSHRHKIIREKKQYQIGNFKIVPFAILHDVNEPLGFLIWHEEIGTTLFVNDTHYLENTFKGLNNIIIEANYVEEIISRKSLDESFKTRIRNSHMELSTTIEFLKANDISEVNNIVLVHLSDGNSDADMFYNKVTEATGKSVHIAEKGLSIEFNKEM